MLPPQIQGLTALGETTAGLPASSLPAAASVCAYADFYALVEPPFGMTPNTRFVFWGGSVSLALEQVMLGVRAREGVMVVTGGTGTGKTMLCRALAHHLRPHTFLSMVVNPTLGPTDLLKQILDDFGVTSNTGHPATGTNYELFRTLEQFLVAQIPQGDQAVILIDEAHHLQPQVLEQIRLLSNLEGQDAKLLQIVLMGRPDLGAVLGQPDQRELNQRVSRHCELIPLTPADTYRYIIHRLAVAQALSTTTVDDPTPVQPVLVSGGASQGLQVRQVDFTPAAVAAVAAISRGVPRIINLLCDRALEGGFAREVRTIDGAHVLAAAVTLKLGMPTARRRVSGRTFAAAAAVVALLAVGAATRSRWLPAAPRPEPIAVPVAVRPAPIVGTLETARPVTIAVASLRIEDRPAEFVAKLVDLGLPAFDRITASGGWHQVTVGPYVSVEEARVAELQITGVGLTNEPIVSIGATPKAGRVLPIAALGRSDAAGADNALARMAMLTVADRGSLVLELRDAGVEAVTQSADATTLVSDIGPVTRPVLAEERDAEPDTPCVAHVSIQELTVPNRGRFVRLRIALRSACSSQKRIAGRRVYIDFAAPGSTSSTPPVTASAVPKPPDRPAADPGQASPSIRASAPGVGRPDPPAGPAAAPLEADVLGRARALSQVPDVRGLMRLRDDAVKRAEKAGQLESDDFKHLIEAVERYTNEARALQLQIDGRGLRGSDPRDTGTTGRSGAGTPRDPARRYQPL